MRASGDPLKDADRYDYECQQLEDVLPTCSDCGEPITEDECYDFGGDLICVHCMEQYKVCAVNYYK